jgi:2'-phosphotransferase
MRNDGYVLMSDLLSHQKYKSLGVTLEEIKGIVRNNDKQRFTLAREIDANGKDVVLIRANQGHSIAVDVEMNPLLSVDQFPNVVIHGTNNEAWKSIRVQGLSCMGRNHIHMASGKPKEDGVISGMRVSSSVLIYIDFENALSSGIKFYKSSNGVILSPGNDLRVIPPQFFLKVEDRHGNLIS